VNPTLRRALFLAALAALTAACGGKQNADTTEVIEEVVVENATVRVLHAASATGANVVLGTNSLAEDIRAGSVSDPDTVVPGALPLVVTSPSGASELLSTTLDLAPGTTYLIVLHGTAADSTLGATAIEWNAGEIAADTAHVRFFNAAQNAGPVDFTADGRAYASGVNYGGISDWYPIPAGALALDAAGGMASAETTSVSLVGGRSYVIVTHPAGEGVGVKVVVD
jgi:hypothetical protein